LQEVVNIDKPRVRSHYEVEENEDATQGISNTKITISSDYEIKPEEVDDDSGEYLLGVVEMMARDALNKKKLQESKSEFQAISEFNNKGESCNGDYEIVK